jgi:hypothetical protein
MEVCDGAHWLFVMKKAGDRSRRHSGAHRPLDPVSEKGMVPEAELEGNKAPVLGWKQQLKGSK